MISYHLCWKANMAREKGAVNKVFHQWTDEEKEYLRKITQVNITEKY